MTPKRPGSPRVARAPTVKRGVPAASKAWTTPEYWSATHTVAPPGEVAIAWGNRKTPAPCGGSPTAHGLHAGARGRLADDRRAQRRRRRGGGGGGRQAGDQCRGEGGDPRAAGHHRRQRSSRRRGDARVVPGGVQHRTMKRIAAIVLLLACALPASAGARVHRWRVSADVTGHYANDVTGTGRCAAHWQEAVTGLRMRLTATQPLAYDPQV